VDAVEAHRLGGVDTLAARAALDDETRSLAARIAAKSPVALRLAKQSLNGIELLDVVSSYRFEQGFTLELYTRQDSQEARDAFVEKRDA
jgi:enoyl-CoA hydratase